MGAKQFFGFLGIAYLTALLFEIIAHLVDPLNMTFDNAEAIVFAVFWYGAIYSVSFLVFRKSSPWIPALTWAVFGTVIEMVLFKRLNLVVDPIIYFIMFFVPFFVYRSFIAT